MANRYSKYPTDMKRSQHGAKTPGTEGRSLTKEEIAALQEREEGTPSKRIMKAWLAGDTPRQICKRFGYSEPFVVRVVENYRDGIIDANGDSVVEAEHV